MPAYSLMSLSSERSRHQLPDCQRTVSQESEWSGQMRTSREKRWRVREQSRPRTVLLYSSRVLNWNCGKRWKIEKSWICPIRRSPLKSIRAWWYTLAELLDLQKPSIKYNTLVNQPSNDSRGIIAPLRRQRGELPSKALGRYQVLY